MAKNHKVSCRSSVMVHCAKGFVGVILTIVLGAFINMKTRSELTQLMKSIGEKERQLEKSEDELTRSITRWQAMTTPVNLERSMRKLGVSMKYPKEQQIIRMDANGKVKPGSIAVAKAALRNSYTTSAQYNGKPNRR